MADVIIQQVYAGSDYIPMLVETFERHARYASRWGWEYRAIIGNVRDDWPMTMGGWAKLALIEESLQAGFERVAWVDADAVIVDLNTDLRGAFAEDRIGVTWHTAPQPHFNVGMLYVGNGEQTRMFFGEWIAQYPGPEFWREQAVFNAMAQGSPVVVEIDRRWNSCYHNNDAPDPVVATFHGCGPAEYRLRLMREALCGR